MEEQKFLDSPSLDKKIQVTNDTREKKFSLSGDEPPYWVIQCRMVSLETIDTQTTKIDSAHHKYVYVLFVGL